MTTFSKNLGAWPSLATSMTLPDFGLKLPLWKGFPSEKEKSSLAFYFWQVMLLV